MKICPTCRRTYAEATLFCLDDGTPLQPAKLQVASTGAAQQSTVVGPVPTETPAPTAVDSPSSRPPPLPRPPSQPTPASEPFAAPTPATQAKMAATRPAGSAGLRRVSGARTSVGPVPAPALSEAETFVANMEANDDPDAEQSAYIGKVIDDRYLILDLIGRGGMGAVYKCEQIHLRKAMAIKLLHESLVSKKQLISRFTREARAISRLSSPHTVMVYDFGRWGELFFLVMELLEGEPLDSVLESDGPMPAERATEILLQMCHSLAEAHEHGVVHRDLKPENVMLVRHPSEKDFVKVLDFGLAKVEGADDPYTIHSQRDIFGTPFYMSPEQIRAGEIDHRADVYAVGALAFKMLSGRHVFAERSTFDILKAHLSRTAGKMSEPGGVTVPAALEQIVQRCLEKDPARRFQSMGELGKALETARAQGFADAGLEPLPPSIVVPPLDDLAPQTRRSDAAHSAPAPVAVAPSKAPAEQKPGPTAAHRPKRETGDQDPLADEVMRASAGRSQRVGAVAFAAVVALVVAGGVLALWAGSGGGDEEQEPNDTPRQANALGSGGKVAGVIGKRRSAQAADQDCYRLPAHNDGDALSAVIVGPPNMDLQVTLHGAGGDTQSTWSHRGKGQGEVLHNVELRPGIEVMCVTEAVAAGAVASESLSDQYQLTVVVDAPVAGSEREPNDQGPGNELQPASQRTGSLDGPLDRDVYQLQGTLDGRLVQAELDVDKGVPQSGLHMALVDAAGRVLAAQRLRPGDRKGLIALAVQERMLPDQLVLERPRVRDGTAQSGDELEYTLRYDVREVGDQPEREPNNTPESATPMVLGAWHTGSATDAAGVDWLRIDGGDPSMARIRIEATALAGNAFVIVVRDQGSQVDLRQVQVGGQPGTAGANAAQEQELLVTGSGEGFLLRIQQIDAAGRKNKPDARYQIRARFAPEDVPK
jgi:serine/threonine-protein kinase